MNLQIYYQIIWVNQSVNVGDEGGFAPTIKTTESVLDYISDSVSKCGYSFGTDIIIGLDCAANNFWDLRASKYIIDGKSLNSGQLLDYYILLCDRYPIKIIEDPFVEEDLDSFAKLTAKMGNRTCIVGDDIFVTNKARVIKGINLGYANSVIIKINQVGTDYSAMDGARTALFEFMGNNCKSQVW